MLVSRLLEVKHPSAKMGFFKSCLDALLQALTLSPQFGAFDDPQLVLSNPGKDIAQTPLDFISSHPSTIIEPENASPGFQCVYPKRWTSCNTATSRDCWLRDNESTDEFGAYSQIDINTDCEFLFDVILDGPDLTAAVAATECLFSFFSFVELATNISCVLGM